MSKKVINQKSNYETELLNSIDSNFVFNEEPINRLKNDYFALKIESTQKTKELDHLRNEISSIEDCSLKNNSKKIILGDFNNTAYSWVYQKIKSGKKDAFIEAGNGFGKTFNYPFPMRIDFILTSTDIDINQFKTFNESFSDHFPIQANLNW